MNGRNINYMAPETLLYGWSKKVKLASLVYTILSNLARQYNNHTTSNCPIFYNQFRHFTKIFTVSS
jgi:hypothetical protein